MHDEHPEVRLHTQLCKMRVEAIAGWFAAGAIWWMCAIYLLLCSKSVPWVVWGFSIVPALKIILLTPAWERFRDNWVRRD